MAYQFERAINKSGDRSDRIVLDTIPFSALQHVCLGLSVRLSASMEKGGRH